MGARQSRRASINQIETAILHGQQQQGHSQAGHSSSRLRGSSSTDNRVEVNQGVQVSSTPRNDRVDEFIVSRELIGILTPQELESIALENSLAYSPMPFGWEKTTDESKNTYFIDHLNKVTTFQDPRITTSLYKSRSSPPPYKYTLYNKVQHFRAKLYKLHCGKNSVGTLMIDVERGRVFEDSLNLILLAPVEKLISRLHIKFSNEKGLDYGGMSREWFLEISREITNPQRGLFLLSLNGYDYSINPKSVQIVNYKKYFEFVGTILGMAIYHGMLLPCFFCDTFYKYLLDLPVGLEDVKDYDLQVYHSLKYILEQAEVEDLGLYFTVTDQDKNEVLLKEKGDQIPLTKLNKKEYIKLCVNYYLKHGKREQYKNLKKGIRKLIPKDYIVRKHIKTQPFQVPDYFKLVENNFNDYKYDIYTYFTLFEVKNLLGGGEVIDVFDLQRWTQYELYSPNDDVIKWFWEIVFDMDQQDLSLLLQFVTGTHRVPIGGFEHLYGSNGPSMFTLTKVEYLPDKLPSAHSCFNRLDLPEYPQKSILTKNLYYAIRETKGFNLE